MPDKKLTDSEIVKALECCGNANDCGNCEYEPTEHQIGTVGCSNELMKDTLDLINRLQEKNKNLQERNVILRGLVDTQKAENERLKKGWKADVILTANVKAEAYKECIEKVKALFPSDNEPYQYWEIHEGADNLLKELVGEGGGNK